jgi:hypothetical protein
VVTPRRSLVCALALAALALPASAAAGPTYFQASYKGAGSFHTKFHATPPNPGGDPDTNDAHDTSRQSWDVRYRGTLAIPDCGSAEPCDELAGLDGLRGATKATGRVNHKHVDGLYRELDRSEKCRLSEAPSRKKLLAGTLSVRYIPESDSFGIKASDPVQTALELFPAQCAGQGDGIDRILDFYAMPGFSFVDGFGPEPWFASGEVVVPATRFHGLKAIKVPLHDTPAGTPPKDCAVHDPSFERCRTGGAWNGVLTLKPVPPPAVARAALSKVKPPQSGKYGGHAGPHRDLVLYTSGKSIQLAAFDFACGATSGRTSLNDIPMKKSKKGYKFAIKASGSASFADERPDENVRIQFQGRFGRTGRAAVGTLRVRAAGCPDTGVVKWSAKR